MIQTSPLWLINKQLNWMYATSFPGQEQGQRVCLRFLGNPDPKTDVAFLRCDKTLRVDPTFWF